MSPSSQSGAVGNSHSGSSSLMVRTPYDPDHRVVAVTGAQSFLGKEVIRRLEEDRRYDKILAIDIRKPDIPMTKTQFHKVDLTLPNADEEVAHVLSRERADTLAHLALLSKPTHNKTWAHELEAIGTMYVLNACAACKVHKVVLWSLTALYGAHPQNPNFLDETNSLRGVAESRFFTDKLEAERLARRFRNENQASVVTILRMAHILGRRFNNYVSRFIAMPTVPVMAGYDPVIQLLHEEDAIEAFKLSIDSDFNGEYNVASEGVLPLSTVLAMAGRVAIPVPHFLAFPLAKVLWMTQVLDLPPMYFDFLRFLCVADIDKAKEEMGFSPRYDIRDIIREFAGSDSPADSALGASRKPSGISTPREG